MGDALRQFAGRAPRPPGGHAGALGTPDARAGRRMTRYVRAVVIVWVILRYGLDELALSGFRLRGSRGSSRFGRGRGLDAPRGQRLRQALEALGPIFVKFGQVLSTRRDLLPRTSPTNSRCCRTACRRSRRRWRWRPSSAPSSGRSTPSSRASSTSRWPAPRSRRCTSPRAPAHGEVKDVAVKVLRPGMLTVIEKDLDLMRMMARWVESSPTTRAA